MFEERPHGSRTRWTLAGLALPLLLARCADAGDGGAVLAGGAGGTPVAQSGSAGALAGAGEMGGAPTGGGGAADSTQDAGRGGDSTAGAAEGGAGGELLGAAGAGAGAGAGGELLGAAGNRECDVQLESFTNPSAAHVSVCSLISYPMNPPVYGDHYPVWAAYKSYPFAVPLGFLVHDLEHGAIVLLYNCPEGCADEVAAAQGSIDALPADPRCTDDVKHQVVMSPDPSLPTRWAAISWGHSLSAACFLPSAFRTFYDANLAHGGEDTCANGEDIGADACP